MSTSTAEDEKSAAPLPPGTFGPPLLGETLALLRDPFGFVESRAQRLGPVFRTRLLGRRAAVITGPDATARFVDDQDVQRGGAMPDNIRTLFGGHTLPSLDGEEHHRRKRLVMAAFTHDAVAGYLPTLGRLARASLARWTAADVEMQAVGELRRLAIEAIAETMLGLQPGAAVTALRADYEVVLRGFSGLPISLPGTAYSRAKRALARALQAFRGEIRGRSPAAGVPAEPPARAAAPTATTTDGLARILAARAAAGAAAELDDDALAREVHHLFMAGLIFWAWCGRAFIELDRHPGVRARLLAELDAAPAGDLTLETLETLPYLDQVTDEIRRVSPVVPVFFGQARRSFTFAGHTIPEGWMVVWGATASHLRPEVYPSPERFDPDRFSAARAEHLRHPHAFAPNGAGDVQAGHKCAGYLFAPTFLKIFIAELVRGYTWLLTPDQDLSYDWSAAPPPPKSGLRLRLRARAQRATAPA